MDSWTEVTTFKIKVPDAGKLENPVWLPEEALSQLTISRKRDYF